MGAESDAEKLVELVRAELCRRGWDSGKFAAWAARGTVQHGPLYVAQMVTVILHTVVDDCGVELWNKAVMDDVWDQLPTEAAKGRTLRGMIRRSRRRVRRLARLQRRSAYKGSSSSLIANVFTLNFPAAANGTEREGMAAYAYYTPSLAQVVEQVNKVQAQQPGTVTRYSGAYHISIPKQRFEFGWTPNWPAHQTTAVAMRVQIQKFVLTKKAPINDIICTPAYTDLNGGAIANMCHYGATNYSSAVPTGINGIPYDHTVGILARYAAGTNAGVTPSPTQWNDTRKDPLTIFESPAAVSKITLKWTKDFYIPYGQSMAFSCGHGPVNVSYNDLEINRPELFVAKTVSDKGDNFITPFLPAGWPFFIIKIQKHKADGTVSVTSPSAADSMGVAHRIYYRCPDFTGRMLTYNNPNSVSDGGTVPSSANVFLTANGNAKTAAYTGLNI